jgi:hypothetical protein
MNRNLKALFLLLAVVLMGSFPVQAAERPFSLTGAGTVSTSGVVSASGHASHLGLFTEAGQVNFVPDSNDPTRVLATGTATFTAANGDDLELLIDGSLDLTTGEATGLFTFVGGTGRFEGASGTGNFVIQQNLVTGAFEVTAVGTINF